MFVFIVCVKQFFGHKKSGGEFGGHCPRMPPVATVCRGVPKSDGARDKEQAWRPHVRT